MAKTKKIKKEKKLNSFTEEKNNQAPVEIKEREEMAIVGEETLLPETKSIIPITQFAMPIAKPEQLKQAMELYQQCVNALIQSKDIVLVDGKPHGKKIAVNKINRVFGVSTEVIRSFMEEHIAVKDYWSKGFQKVVLVRKGEKYFIAKAWVKAILPNGQFATRGGAVSETERRFAHFPHDLLATAETRAMKNACVNLLGVEFEMIDDENNETTPKKNEYKPQNKENNKRGAIVNPNLPATPKQKDYINAIIAKLKNDYEIETTLEKSVDSLNKGEAAGLIEKLIERGKEARKKIQIEFMKKDDAKAEEIIPILTEPDGGLI